MRTTLVREMVDLAIDQAQMEHPHVDFSILLCPAHAAALDATSYRGHEVVATDLVDDSLVRLEPLLDGDARSARACSYVVDLDEEIISVYGRVLDPAQVASSAASATAAAASAVSRSVSA